MIRFRALLLVVTLLAPVAAFPSCAGAPSAPHSSGARSNPLLETTSATP
ncbi:MAG TPA: hypothetical protein VN607_00285 [Gemmatimonadaceae bacterium]|nr:hypothetical protein [Gemmatimonadaceae bacterium]